MTESFQNIVVFLSISIFTRFWVQWQLSFPQMLGVCVLKISRQWIDT
jgi:hypothetical protein